MLQSHENEDIYKLAYEIIDQFFSGDVSTIYIIHCILLRVFVIQYILKLVIWPNSFFFQPEGELAPEEGDMGFQFDPSAALPPDGQFKFWIY